MRKRTPVRCHPDRDSETRGGLPKAADPQQASPILAESPAQPASATVTVFYDGACPLCATEIGFYQRRRGAEKVAWVDASACSDSILASGRWVSGGRAFAALWSALPTFSWLGKLFQMAGLAWLLDRFYDLFLRWVHICKL